ncbi:sphingolipid delta-4 desaturase, partial [Nannochloropsis oceanica]
MCPGPQHDKANVLLDSSMVAAAAGAGVNEKEEGVWEFFRSYTEEPHKSRRESIIKAHPEIRKLFGPCPWTKYKVAAIITIQVLAAIILRSAPFPLLLLLTYTLSGSCNHFLTLTMHEVAHNLAFKGLVANRIFSIIANLPLGIPAAISFKRYHMEHHKYQGNEF